MDCATHAGVMAVSTCIWCEKLVCAASFGPLDILFYAIGAWTAFRLPAGAKTRA
jgi:hypothetical protein